VHASQDKYFLQGTIKTRPLRRGVDIVPKPGIITPRPLCSKAGQPSKLLGSGRLQLRPRRVPALPLRMVSEFHQRTFSNTEGRTLAFETLLEQMCAYLALRIATQSISGAIRKQHTSCLLVRI